MSVYSDILVSLNPSINNNNYHKLDDSITNQHYSLFESNYNKPAAITSNIELDIRNSKVPIEISEPQEVVSINGVDGKWANKSECLNWHSSIPLSQYKLNQDPNPEIINKKYNAKLEHKQTITYKYLKPPSPAQPGDLVIKQENESLAPCPPPLIVRVSPTERKQAEKVIIREEPPKPPEKIQAQTLTIPGRVVVPRRRVVIERLPEISKPPAEIVVERWLDYPKRHRNVIFQPGARVAPQPAPRNSVVEWEKPQIEVKRTFRYLGVEEADPNEYMAKYGRELVSANDLPELVGEFKVPEGEELAASANNSALPTLVGDIHALGLVDLDRHGLGEYIDQIQATDAYNYGTEPHTRSLAEIFAKREQDAKENREKDLNQAENKDFGDNINRLIEKLAGFVEIERKTKPSGSQKKSMPPAGLSAVIYLNPAVKVLDSSALSSMKEIDAQLAAQQTKESKSKDSLDSGYDEHVERLIDQLADLVEEHRRSRSSNLNKLNSSATSSSSSHSSRE
jgi:hypothetical protein